MHRDPIKIGRHTSPNPLLAETDVTLTRWDVEMVQPFAEPLGAVLRVCTSKVRRVHFSDLGSSRCSIVPGRRGPSDTASPQILGGQTRKGLGPDPRDGPKRNS